MKKENKVYLVRCSENGNVGAFTSVKKVYSYLAKTYGAKFISKDSKVYKYHAFTYENLLKTLRGGYWTQYDVKCKYGTIGTTYVDIEVFNLNQELNV